MKLREGEIARMARFLDLSEFDFVQRFTRLRGDRQGLALTDKENGECVFLDGMDCRINAVKPRQCREFPNLWNFPNFQEVCRAKAVVLDEAAHAEEMRRAMGDGA